MPREAACHDSRRRLAAWIAEDPSTSLTERDAVLDAVAIGEGRRQTSDAPADRRADAFELAYTADGPVAGR